ncbi:hypothetical protein GCM10009609_48700 [Pseudonocardia aurantiaca]
MWTRSGEAVGDELDLHISATHLADPSISPTGGAIVLATAVTQPDDGPGRAGGAPGDRGDQPARAQAPNKHHFVVDLSPFGLENPNEVFYAADRPYGLIEATVTRS